MEIKKGSLHDLIYIKKILLSSKASNTAVTHEDTPLSFDTGCIRIYPSIWDVFLTRFIRYLEGNWSQVVDLISSFDPPDLPSGTQFPRFQEVYRVLSATARIVLQYFVKEGTLPRDREDAMFHSLIAALQEVIRENDVLGEESDPAKLFIEIIIQGLAQKLFVVADSKKQYETNPNQYLGFWDKDKESADHLILDPNRAFGWAESQLRDAKRRFTVTPTELWRKLADQNFSEGYEEKGRKTPRPLLPISINGKSIRMLALWRHKLEN